MRKGQGKYGHPIGALFDLHDGRKVAGQVTLEGGELFQNTAKLSDDSSLSVPIGSSLYGMSEHGMVSLLDCHGSNLATTRWDASAFFRCDLSFRYVLFGRQHLHPEDKAIMGIQFTFDEIDAILSNQGFDAFGHILDPDDEIIDAIERCGPDYQADSFRKDGSAMVSYFTGKYELLPKTETVLGTIQAARSLHIDAVSPNMKEVPYMSIDFDDDPTTLGEALGKMRIVRQFCAWMIGYTPRWRDVRVFTSKLVDGDYRKNDSGHPDNGLEVFGPTERRGGDGDRSDITWQDVLIDASRDPDHFANVMTQWLERNSDSRRRSANNRFFGSMSGMAKKTVEDGICSAPIFSTCFLLPTNRRNPQSRKTSMRPWEKLARRSNGSRRGRG